MNMLWSIPRGLENLVLKALRTAATKAPADFTTLEIGQLDKVCDLLENRIERYSLESRYP